MLRSHHSIAQGRTALLPDYCPALSGFRQRQSLSLPEDANVKPALSYRCAARSAGVSSRLVGEKMGIATDILNLRHNRFSSVTTLIAALERFHGAPQEKLAAKLFRVDEATDLVLTNVAAHAAEAMVAQQPTTARTRRAISMRRKNRRFNSGPTTLQRPLFAALGRFLS